MRQTGLYARYICGVPGAQLTAALLAALLIAAAPAAAQETEPWEMEWEPDEGYHEEEWYDPSDWIDVDSGVSYEYDWDDYQTYDYSPYTYDSTYYNNYDYDYGWHYDNLANDWEYGSHYEDAWNGNDWDYGWYWDDAANDWDYGYHRDPYDYGYDYYDYDPFEENYASDLVQRDWGFDRELTGEVVGLSRLRTREGRAETVRLRVRTQDGGIRTVQLGDYAYARENLPRLRKGEKVRIAGKSIRTSDGRRRFKALQVRSAGGTFDIPDYQYDRVITGRLAGLKSVRTHNGELRGAIAKVKTPQGRTVNVVLGSPSKATGAQQQIRPGDEIRANGFVRTLNGYSTFFARDVQMRGEANRQSAQRQNQRQPHEGRQMERPRQQRREQDRRQGRPAQQRPDGEG